MSTKQPLQAALARSEDLVIQELADEVLIYDLRLNKAHCLNRTSAFIWNHCDGENTADEIARLMETEWRTPVSRDMVLFGMARLHKAGLLEAPIKLPRSEGRISRRTAVWRLGALLAVPAVISIVAPTAMAAVSIPSECKVCIDEHTSTGCPHACLNIEGHCFTGGGCGTKTFTTKTCAQCFATKAINSWIA